MSGSGRDGRTLYDTLRRINAFRHRAPSPRTPSAAARALEETVERRYACSTRLAVYGSLVPGRANAHLLEGIEGAWTRGVVHGYLHDRGWGSGQGYPGLVWDSRGNAVPVHVLSAPGLIGHWRRLDAFEGDEYLRILVPVSDDAQRTTVANLYALRR